MLNALELTGRATTHVRDFPEHKCALHARAARAMRAMRHEAMAHGIHLDVASGFRDFERQVAIWTAKFTGKRPLLDKFGRELAHAGLSEPQLIDAILIWSALPGASRHHWGSELDVFDSAALPAGGNPQLVAQEFAPGGCFARCDLWLSQNMRRFGFFRPYTTDRGGVQPEPWHLSYAEVSVPASKALSIDVLRAAICASDMPGRAIVLDRLAQLYERYVLAVDSP
jgi:LAS superfamily LD-carboxypeptidase LdcB